MTSARLRSPELFGATSAADWLMACWKDLMDGAGVAETAYMKGAIDALWQTGQIDGDHAELWRRRIETCPENTPDDPGHIGGRAWCAYCGDVPRSEQGALRQPTGDAEDDLEPPSESAALPDLVVVESALVDRS